MHICTLIYLQWTFFLLSNVILLSNNGIIYDTCRLFMHCAKNSWHMFKNYFFIHLKLFYEILFIFFNLLLKFFFYWYMYILYVFFFFSKTTTACTCTCIICDFYCLVLSFISLCCECLSKSFILEQENNETKVFQVLYYGIDKH